MTAADDAPDASARRRPGLLTVAREWAGSAAAASVDRQRTSRCGASFASERRERDGAPFSQRFTGTFSEDGKTIAGHWEIAEDGKASKTDFDLTYTKVD